MTLLTVRWGVDEAFSEDIFTNDNSSFDSDSENNVRCMNDDVFLPNIPEWHSNSDSFAPTTKNDQTVEIPCSKWLIACEYITSGACMSYFGKWIDVGETALPHFNFAGKSELATAAENSMANSSSQGIISTGLQNIGQLSMT